MAILRFKKDVDTALSPHFNVREFVCPCPQCTETLVDSALITLLEKMRSQTGPLKISSGYRCQHYQSELCARGYPTSSGISTHSTGRAVDVKSEDSRFSGATLEQFARQAGFRAVGVAPSWVHVDLRDDKDRRWTYAK